MTQTEIAQQIRDVLAAYANLATEPRTLPEDTDLYSAGMTSHATVNVMLALEARFDIEFPDRMLRSRVFGSIGSIRAAVEELTARQ